MSSESVLLFIDGKWLPASGGRTKPIVNPATEAEIGRVAVAGDADLDRAVAAAECGFRLWRSMSPLVRSDIMRRAAGLLRDRGNAIAAVMTREQGKPVAEALTEILASADIIDWFAEEGRRAYGRIIPARQAGVFNLVLKEPVGPVAAFTPWNFPISQAARKLGAALAAGCSVVIKPPEETPASPAELIRAFADAGLPGGVINMVYGEPAHISNFLIAHPTIRKISFTGSTTVGKQLASLAGAHVKRVTMELGGHAPAIVFGDADVQAAATVLAAGKYRNAGQVCIAPTRFVVHEDVYDQFMRRFTERTAHLKMGDGSDPDTTIGPLANERRQTALQDLVDDAVNRGAVITTGGKRRFNKGYYFEPTILEQVPRDARIMNEEPFGPVTVVSRFRSFDDAVSEANRLPYGLAAYAYSRSLHVANMLTERIESGMLSINHYGLALPETPFGGVKDSGYGSEGGLEAVDAYLATKFVSQTAPIT